MQNAYSDNLISSYRLTNIVSNYQFKAKLINKKNIGYIADIT